MKVLGPVKRVIDYNVKVRAKADGKRVLAVRAAVFTVSGAGGSLSAWVEDKVATSDRPELTSAGIVVLGGAGLVRRRTSHWSKSWPTSWALPWVPQEQQSDCGHQHG